MKRFLRFWLPPLLWMGVMFPYANTYLGSSAVYEITLKAARWIFPDITLDQFTYFYIPLRKSFHFIEYAVLVWLLFRAFRAGRKREWNGRWLLYAGAVSVLYGGIDELAQTMIASRHGSLIDVGVDVLGVGFAAILIFRRRGKKPPSSPCLKALFLKRPFDICLSGIGMLISSPIWLFLAFMIWIEDRGSIFYSQDRVGRNGRTFRAFKFRSMVMDAEAGGPVQAVENDPRVTRIGRIMRATAMDELPQLFNIFRGDMSFVGPRALRPEEKEVHGDGTPQPISEIPGYDRRHQVRPGLTGLTQVKLPTDAPRRKKFRYDLLYIRKKSFWLDLKLIILSFWITFRGKWESRENKV